jgi:predicted HicB family RNase H-like nuclease
MKYKGYTGIVEFDEASGLLFGRVIGLRDVITFEGESVAEVIQAFHDSVDVYLEFCAERGESPEKPCSGQFVLRLDPKLHRELTNAAQARKTSLNALIEGILEENVHADKLAASKILARESPRAKRDASRDATPPARGRRQVVPRRDHRKLGLSGE